MVTTFKLQNGDEIQSIGFGPGGMGYNPKMKNKEQVYRFSLLG